MENIGKVTMNYDYYSGTDLYSDGDVEDILLEIVKTHDKNDFPKPVLPVNKRFFSFSSSKLFIKFMHKFLIFSMFSSAEFG